MMIAFGLPETQSAFSEQKRSLRTVQDVQCVQVFYVRAGTAHYGEQLSVYLLYTQRWALPPASGLHL